MRYADWDNLPWTARGRKFKYYVEGIGFILCLFIVVAIAGMWQ